MWYPVVASVILLISNDVTATRDLTELLGTLAREIVLKYFMDLPVNNTCLGIITEDDNEILDYLLPLDISIYHIELSHQEFMYSKRIATEFEEYPWEEKIMETINAPCLGYVIQTSNIKWMVKSFARMYHNEKAVQRFNRTFLYLPVVARLMPEAEFELHVSEVFRLRVMDFMPDLDIVKVVKEMYTEPRHLHTLTQGDLEIFLDDMNIEIITNRYVGLNSHDRILLDGWNAKTGFANGANIYPYKMTNLMGKKIGLVTIDYPPITVIDWDADPSTYDGLEPQFIFEWGRRLNFTYNWYHDDTYFGKIYENGSGTGMFGMLSMDIADIAFNAFFLWEPEHHYMDYSTSHSKTTNTLICPKPRLLSGWKVVILPFTYGMWAAVMFSVAVCTVILYMTSLASFRFLGRGTGAKMSNMYSSWVECAFRTSGLLVLQVPPDERDWSTPRYVPMRHLVTWLILFYFVVTTAYSGGLATVLTVPRREKPIETMEDMAERSMKWTGLLEAYVNMIENTISPVLTQVVKNFHFEAEGDDLIPWLTEKTKSGEYCIVVEQMLGGHFFLAPFITEETMNFMRLTKEGLYSSVTVFATRKGTPLMHHMNAVLRRARDAGLFFYWEDLTVRNYLSTRRQLSVLQSRIQVDEGPTKLQVHHIEGSFYLLAVGLVTGTVVFIFEVLIHNMELIKGAFYLLAYGLSLATLIFILELVFNYIQNDGDFMKSITK